MDIENKVIEIQKNTIVRKDPPNCFWDNVDIKTKDDCWNWKYGKAKGYGCSYYNGKKQLSHRVAFYLSNGEIPEGKIICHKCNNPACCNPRHLYAGTKKDNAIDRENRFLSGDIPRWNGKPYRNPLKRINKLGYRGISIDHGGFRARFRGISLGYFNNLIDAAIAYDKKAKEYYGDSAILNFPEVANV
jgi:hypothetical protein